MPLHKITWEFESTVGVAATSGSKQGWTESWYDTNDADDDTAATTCGIAAEGRRSILTPGWSLVSSRVSRWSPNTGLSRRGRHIFYPPLVAVGTYPGVSQDEQPYDALVVAWNTAGGFSRSRDLRGIPQETVNAGGRYLAPLNFRNRFASFSEMMRGAAGDWGLILPAPYGFRVRTANGPYAITDAAVDSVSTTTGTPQSPGVTFTPPVGGVVGPGTVCSISGAYGLRGLNGQWKVDSIVSGPAASSVRLRQKRRHTVVGPNQPGGFITFYTYALDPVTEGFPEYGSSRRTGRPTQLPRGRRSASTT